MTDEPSPFMPPRKRWYSGILSLGYFLRGKWHRDRARTAFLQSPRAFFETDLYLSAILPTYGFFRGGRLLLGYCVLVAYLGAATFLFVRLGYSEASYALYGLLLLHVSGFSFVLHHASERPPLKRLLWLTILAYAFAIACIYVPLGRVVRAFVAIPLNVEGKVVIVNPRVRAQDLRHGDSVAFSIEPIRRDNFRVESGNELTQLLAVGDDQVRFGYDHFFVNETRVFGKKADAMPKAGDLAVPENHLFVWPTVANSLAQRQGGEIIPELVFVPTNRVLGTPYRSWFGRKQELK